MKRDMDLVRKILLQVENDSNVFEIAGYDRGVILKHIELMEEAELIKAYFHQADQGLFDADVERLTWQGHEFLDAARSDTIWNKAKRMLEETIGSVPLTVLKDLLMQLVLSELGLPSQPGR